MDGEIVGLPIFEVGFQNLNYLFVVSVECLDIQNEGQVFNDEVLVFVNQVLHKFLILE